MVDNYYAWDEHDPLLVTFSLFGDAGIKALEDAKERGSLKLIRATTSLQEQLAAWKRPDYEALADAAYANGNIAPNRFEQGKHIDTGAYALYALALLFDPNCKHAARCCAEIDRAGGTPITRERELWIS